MDLYSGPTPIEVALRHELDREFLRFANEWIFKWHNINIQGQVVDVEDFFGGRFHVGGIRFEGQIQDLFWRSLEKYLRDCAHAGVGRWRTEAATYPAALKRSSLEGVCGELRSFAARVVAHGRDADRRLRGGGFPDSVPYRETNHTLGKVNVAIQDLELAEKALLIEPPPPAAPARKSAFKRAEEFFTEWRSTLAVVSLLLAALGLALRYLLG